MLKIFNFKWFCFLSSKSCLMGSRASNTRWVQLLWNFEWMLCFSFVFVFCVCSFLDWCEIWLLTNFFHKPLIICTLLKTAALAQRNSEDTRTLAVQEDILEKELLEMQKVLLAMQVKVKMIIITDQQNSVVIWILIPFYMLFIGWMFEKGWRLLGFNVLYIYILISQLIGNC